MPQPTPFTNPHIVLPVIHVVNTAQAKLNAQIAYEAGADGVFLINHEDEGGERPLTYRHLLDIHQELSQTIPGWWLGVNCLDLPPHETFAHLTPQVAGVWVDNAYIDERQTAQTAAEQIAHSRQQSQWQGLYFGGVAFKYQREVADVARAAQTAVPYIDIITTSGTATGQAAHLHKIQQIRAAIGPHPLAIASGLTPENIAAYLPYANYFLVATGISRSFDSFDPARVRAFVQRVRRGVIE
ncbi:MAG: adenine phosphoribosyltransferase [Ardenticatenaceae bacterium]|nr:adenine phosphoribosyltransferase [Ardenticatenaceae bacterium]